MVKDARSLFTKSADETICEAFDECQSERKTRMGDKRLWQAFNSAYRPKNAQASAPSLLKKQNGSYACGDKPIADAFGEHYKQLGNSATFNADADFDSAFQQEVQAAVSHYINASAEPEGSGDENLDADLTSSEVARARLSLKSGKAGSPLENTSAELLKYGGEPMTAMLLCMYQKAWEHECTFQRPGVIVSLFECPAYDRIREKYNTVLFAQFGGCQEASSTMKHNSDNVRLFMDQEPSFQVAKFVYECMEFRRSEECEDYNPYFDLSLFGDEWQGRIFDTFSSGPRGDIAETFTSDGPGSSISAHGA